MGDVDANDDYIDELTGLVEPSGELMFASSDSKLTIEIDELTNVGNSIAILILVTCLLGLINGIDYTQPESGLVRPDEFVSVLPRVHQTNQQFSMDMSLMTRRTYRQCYSVYFMV